MGSQSDDVIDAVTDVLHGLVLQLIETNSALATISVHVTYLSVSMEQLTDQLRTLNSSVARMEDFHYSAALKGSPSA